MLIEPLDLTLDHCRERQRRLREVLALRKIERAIVLSPENVHYLTGFRPHRLMQAAVCLEVDGDCLLIAPNEIPGHAAADRVVTFPAQHLATLRQDQMSAVIEAFKVNVRHSLRKGTAWEGMPGGWLNALVPEVSSHVIDTDLWTLRRRKDADELALIRRAIDCTHAMYAKAKEIIEPGITELEVFTQLHAAAVLTAGEPLTALGNDFQSHSPGGPPRNRPAKAGELFILDLGPAYRGYYADNCRTFAVDGRPTDEQHQAWAKVVRVLDMVEATVRPGVSCRDLYQQAKAMLDEFRPGAFFHHLGHGIGLDPHETPHLNPHWDDVFQEGDVFTAEPGLYYDELRAGIRLEQDYLVTATGIERLTSFPLEL